HTVDDDTNHAVLLCPLQVLCADLKRSREFYTGILGLEQAEKPSTFNFDVLWYRIGDSQLHMLPSDKPDVRNPRHFALRVDDALALRARLKEHGCIVEETDPESVNPPIPGVDRFFTNDPDSNRIEIMQFFEADDTDT
ncbi:MAG: VOC family protein, partial [Phycisphaeraceae bacterium]|nr:VOC family protein [Phycisphaeraceae bacterium]